MHVPAGSGRLSSDIKISQLRVPDNQFLKSSSRRRLTILSDEGLNDIDGTLGSSFLNEWGGIFLQLGLFLLVVVLGGFHPLVYESTLRDPTTGSKNAQFNPHTLYVVGFFLSFLVATSAAGLVHGSDKILECLSPTATAIMLPVSISIALTETLDIFILQRLDSASKSTLGQVKLPLTALGSVFILQNVVPKLEWCKIFGATFAISGYCAFTGSSVKMDSIGVCLSLFSSFISTCGCLGTEVAFKNGRRRFLVRLAQMRSGAVLVSTIFFFAHVRHYDLWHQSFFHGWTWKVVVLVLWTHLKDWLNQTLIKRLDTLWRTLASSLSLCLSYFGSSLYHRRFEPVLMLFVALLILHVIGLALARVDREKIRKSNRN